MRKTREANSSSLIVSPRAKKNVSLPKIGTLQMEIEHLKLVQLTLLRIASLSAEVKELPDYYFELHQIIRKLLYAENFFIAVLAEDEKTVSVDYFKDLEDSVSPITEAEPIEFFESTLTGYIFRTKKPLLVNDVELKAMVEAGELNVRGTFPKYWLGIPLKIQDKVYGVLVIQSYDPDISYSASDKDVVIFVTQQIASAIQQLRYETELKFYNRKLENEVHERTKDLEVINHNLENEIVNRRSNELLQSALFKISELSNTKIELAEFYQETHQIIGGIMPCKNIFVCTFDSDSNFITFPYVRDESGDIYRERALDMSKPFAHLSPTEQIFKTKKPILMTSKNKSSWLKKCRINGNIPNTWLGVPMLHEESILGVITIQSYNKGDNYTIKNKEVLQFVAQQVAVTLLRRSHADQLANVHQRLIDANDDLERRVSERTKELLKTNASLQDILRERVAMQKRLSHQAFHDRLTGLPNRALFIDRLEHVLQQNKREPLNYLVCFLDLDRFKMINDSLGHLAGDLLLKEVATRLLSCVRPGDTVARLGGDEFCILLVDTDSINAAKIVSDRILNALSKSYLLNDQTVFSSTSIGVTSSKLNYQQASDVIRDADTAMYRAKKNGKACYVIFDEKMHDSSFKRLQIENELRIAVNEKHFEVYFQPVINIVDNSLIGFEALIRWQHKTLGFISPVEFIPIAEETGFIYQIGSIVLEESLRKIKQWQQQWNNIDDLSVSVNVSSKQFENPKLLPDIKTAVKNSQVKHHNIKLEITEGLLIENSVLAQEVLNELDAMGIQVLLDDFGTGYSSLSYLHKFTLHTIKIDRSFVFDMETNQKNFAIIKSIAYMAKQLDLNIVAEGVESKIHCDMLNQLGIHLVQGFYFSKPLNEQDTDKLVEELSIKRHQQKQERLA